MGYYINNKHYKFDDLKSKNKNLTIFQLASNIGIDIPCFCQCIKIIFFYRRLLWVLHSKLLNLSKLLFVKHIKGYNIFKLFTFRTKRRYTIKRYIVMNTGHKALDDYCNNLQKLMKDVKYYEKTELKRLVHLKRFFLLSFLVSLNFIKFGLILIVPVIFVYMGILVEMGCYLYYVIKIYKKKLKFIKDYDLSKCNPTEKVRKSGILIIAGQPLVAFLGTITTSLLVGNWMVEEVSGVNVIRTASKGIINGAGPIEIRQEIVKQFKVNNRDFDNK